MRLIGCTQSRSDRLSIGRIDKGAGDEEFLLVRTITLDPMSADAHRSLQGTALTKRPDEVFRTNTPFPVLAVGLSNPRAPVDRASVSSIRQPFPIRSGQQVMIQPVLPRIP